MNPHTGEQASKKLQDNIATGAEWNMSSSGGSYAFVELRPHKTASCIQQLVDAGCIIIGKANLSVRPSHGPF